MQVILELGIINENRDERHAKSILHEVAVPERKKTFLTQIERDSYRSRFQSDAIKI